MEALLVVDAQNEFSPRGRRPVPNHAEALERILERVEDARRLRHPLEQASWEEMAERIDMAHVGCLGQCHNCLLASRAPATSDSSFAHITVGCTRRFNSS